MQTSGKVKLNPTFDDELARSGKYYSQLENRLLRPEDGCPFDTWLQGSSNAKFAVHPKGFLVFLRPEEIEKNDEYREGDPYGFMSEMKQIRSFHQSRLDYTVHLLQMVLQDKEQEYKILDLGCGRGHITAQIHQYLPASEVSGLDLSLSAVEAAKETYEGIDFVVASAYSPPYCPEYFDVVVCNNIWEHVPDPLRLLEAVNGVLAPGGYLLVSTPSRYRLGNLIRVLFGRPVKLISKHHVTEYTVGQVVEQLRFGGFDAQIFNESLYLSRPNLSNWIMRICMRPLALIYLRLVGSHHSLESTVFYVAKKSV